MRSISRGANRWWVTGTRHRAISTPLCLAPPLLWIQPAATKAQCAPYRAVRFDSTLSNTNTLPDRGEGGRYSRHPLASIGRWPTANGPPDAHGQWRGSQPHLVSPLRTKPPSLIFQNEEPPPARPLRSRSTRNSCTALIVWTATAPTSAFLSEPHNPLPAACSGVWLIMAHTPAQP